MYVYIYIKCHFLHVADGHVSAFLDSELWIFAFGKRRWNATALKGYVQFWHSLLQDCKCLLAHEIAHLLGLCLVLRRDVVIAGVGRVVLAVCGQATRDADAGAVELAHNPLLVFRLGSWQHIFSTSKACFLHITSYHSPLSMAIRSIPLVFCRCVFAKAPTLAPSMLFLPTILRKTATSARNQPGMTTCRLFNQNRAWATKQLGDFIINSWFVW